MDNKTALDTLRVNSKAFIINQGITNENDLLNIYHREAVEIIEKDLEILEILKHNLFVDTNGRGTEIYLVANPEEFKKVIDYLNDKETNNM